MTLRVDGTGDNYDKELKKTKAQGKSQKNNKPTSKEIKEALANLNKEVNLKSSENDLKVKGFFVEQNPDDNTFVDYKDGATKNIQKENKNIDKIIDEYLKNGGKMTTMAVGEEGGSSGAISKSIGEEGSTLVTYALGENGSSADITTKSTGEEGGSLVTYALGENGSSADITTKSTNEEGGSNYTTLAVGEEGGESINIDDKTKKEIAELLDKYLKGRKYTTQAIGEEGGSADATTTKAIGEEGGSNYTTMAVGEEGGADYTTMAVGEEGGDPIKIDGKTKEEIQKIFDEYIKEHRLTTIATSEEGGSDIIDPKKGLL